MTFNLLILKRFSCETSSSHSSLSPPSLPPVSARFRGGRRGGLAGCRTARIAKHKQPRSSKGVWPLLSELFNMPAQSIKPSFFSPFYLLRLRPSQLSLFLSLSSSFAEDRNGASFEIRNSFVIERRKKIIRRIISIIKQFFYKKYYTFVVTNY